MRYIIRMICVNNSIGLKQYQVVYLDNVFGKENYTKDISKACEFISLVRVQKIIQKINNNGNFICDYMRK